LGGDVRWTGILPEESRNVRQVGAAVTFMLGKKTRGGKGNGSQNKKETKTAVLGVKGMGDV